MPEILLTGLRCDVPIAAMAAFGLLRVRPGERLHWADRHAVLTGDVTREDLVEQLVNEMTGASGRPEFGWADTISSSDIAEDDSYLAPASGAVRAATADGHSAAEWFSAFRSDLVRGRIPFDTTSGQQGLLSMARRLADSLDPEKSKKARASSVDAFREALFGPWKYADNQHSLGWDPVTVRLGAFTEEAPTAMEKNGVRAAVWLAMESLPLFPAFSVRGRLRSRGFVERNREFRWPVWEAPVSLATLKSLLAFPCLFAEQPDIAALRARGIQAVYASRVARQTKYGTMQPAVLCG